MGAEPKGGKILNGNGLGLADSLCFCWIGDPSLATLERGRAPRQVVAVRAASSRVCGRELRGERGDACPGGSDIACGGRVHIYGTEGRIALAAMRLPTMGHVEQITRIGKRIEHSGFETRPPQVRFVQFAMPRAEEPLLRI